MLIFDPPIEQAALDHAALSMSAGVLSSRDQLRYGAAVGIAYGSGRSSQAMSEVLRRFGGLAVVSGLGGSGPDGVHRERLRVGLFWFVLAGKPL